jgi:hypothetical protein
MESTDVQNMPALRRVGENVVTGGSDYSCQLARPSVLVMLQQAAANLRPVVSTELSHVLVCIGSIEAECRAVRCEASCMAVAFAKQLQ